MVSFVVVGVAPRTIGRQHAYAVALRPPRRWCAGSAGRWARCAALLILIGNAVTPGKGFREGPFATEVELRELVDLAEQRGVVEHDERQMIHSVFELGDTIAREVMVPRTEMVWIERDKTLRQALVAGAALRVLPDPGDRRERRRRLGVVYLKDLVRRTSRRPTSESPSASTR